MMAEMKFNFKILAALDNRFFATFNKVESKIAGTNAKLREYQTIWQSVAKAQSQGVLSAKYADNAYNRMLNKVEKLPALQANLSKHASSAIQSWAHFDFGKSAIEKIVGLSQKAIEFESSMADVKKVVDFDTPQQFQQMSNDIMELSNRIPIAAEGFAQIVAAGGQSGIAREDLIRFAESAAKMGVAFDITADQAGEMMAKWRTAFKMNQDAVVELADKVNYLGNNTAATAPLISDVITRVGPLGKVGGVASGEIAALGASLVGSGINSEIAATGIQNLILSMTAGASATKTQASAFQKLGFDAVEMSARMQTDARGAIISLLKAVQGLDKAEQASTLQQLFGKESIKAIAPLLSNLEGLETNFAAVADATKYSGSMQGEFNTKANTTANQIQLMKNQIANAQTQISNGFLPIIKIGSNLLGRFASAIGSVSAKCPALTSATILLGTGLVGAYMAANLVTGIFNGVKAAMDGARLITNAYKNSVIIHTITTKAQTAAQWLLNTSVKAGTGLFTGLKKALDACKNSTILYNAVSKIFAAGAKVAAAAQWLFNASLWGCPVLAIAGMVAIAAYIIYKNWDKIVEKMSKAWENIKNLFSEGVQWLKEKWESISKFLSTPIFGKINVMAETAQANATKTGQNATKKEGHLATGGIFNKGAFLTTFAEKSGESAIPHTPNARNIGLLAQTNAIMGNPLGVGNKIAQNGAQNAAGKFNLLKESASIRNTTTTGGNITASFAPQITINGGSEGSTSELDALMSRKMQEFEEMLKRVNAQQRRLSYG